MTAGDPTVTPGSICTSCICLLLSHCWNSHFCLPPTLLGKSSLFSAPGSSILNPLLPGPWFLEHTYALLAPLSQHLRSIQDHNFRSTNTSMSERSERGMASEQGSSSSCRWHGGLCSLAHASQEDGASSGLPVSGKKGCRTWAVWTQLYFLKIPPIAPLVSFSCCAQPGQNGEGFP